MVHCLKHLPHKCEDWNSDPVFMAATRNPQSWPARLSIHMGELWVDWEVLTYSNSMSKVGEWFPTSALGLHMHTHPRAATPLTRMPTWIPHTHKMKKVKRTFGQPLWNWALLASIYKLPLKIKLVPKRNPAAANPIPCSKGNVFLSYGISQEPVHKCSDNQHLMFPNLLKEFTSDWGAGRPDVA